MKIEEFLKFRFCSDPALAQLAYREGEAHFQELLVAALAADFKDEEGALKFEREYPRTTELLKGI